MSGKRLNLALAISVLLAGLVAAPAVLAQPTEEEVRAAVDLALSGAS